jgi:hypothetical protein
LTHRLYLPSSPQVPERTQSALATFFSRTQQTFFPREAVVGLGTRRISSAFFYKLKSPEKRFL